MGTIPSGTRRVLALAVLAVLLASLSGHAAGETRPVAGKVVEVDVDEGTLVLAAPDGARVVLEVPEDAAIVLDGEEGAILDDLFPGDVVEDGEARVLASGGLLLLRATVTSPPGEDPPGRGAGSTD